MAFEDEAYKINVAFLAFKYLRISLNCCNLNTYFVKRLDSLFCWVNTPSVFL